ncbi:tape measure protein [Aggregatibacter aphrophilus]|uniref:Phage-related minor tail protein n=2 Tax=Aggregatibacter aphrophilus TaxID=732 RepID=A0A336N3G5_AGGAP|nr:tape measure protein [Aggregatibacter aphrophilus]KNE84442.1 tail protein [Aggregatibacter aphrophilus ATCC 33389]OBY54766.1 phage tail protein [Aggregatibacter aphrophilus]SSY93946.1 Phage-related minor tail protein [Aggregatibacter aphrophilus]VEF41198.1 Phage-related minor tail protein [Aggregatibacter aphrophilus ATCC 33389]
MAADTLTLAMRIKADVDAAVRNFKQFKAEITGVGTASDRLSAQGKAGAQGLSVLDTVTGQLNNKLKQTKTELNGVSQQLNGFKSQLLGFTAIAGVSLGAKSILLDADAMTSYQARIKLVSRTNNEAKGTFRELMDISNETGNAFKSTAELYTRVYRALGDKANSAELLQFTRTLQQMVVVSGALPEEAKSAIIQLSQGLASGTLRGEEFNSVAEQMPIFLEVLQKSLGKTRAELRKMAEDGELTPQIILSATKEAAAEIEKQYESMPLTIGRAGAHFGNAWTEYLNKTDNAISLTATVAAAISGLANNLDLFGNVALVVAAVAASRFVAGMVQSAVAMARNAAVTAASNNALVARAAIEVKAAQASVAMAASTDRATLATERLALANRNLAVAMRAATFSGLGQSLLALAGGPIGLAITAIFGLYAAYEYIKGKEAELDAQYQQTANSIQSNIEKTQSLIQARKELGEIGGFSERVSQVETNNKAIEEAKAQLDDLIKRRDELLSKNRFSVMGGLINADEINQVNAQIKTLQAAVNDLSETTGELADINQEQLTAAFNAAMEAGGEFAERLKDLGGLEAAETQEELKKAIKSAEEQMQSMSGELTQTEKKLRNELTQATMTATEQLENMKQAFIALSKQAGNAASEMDPFIARINMMIDLNKQIEQAKQNKTNESWLERLKDRAATAGMGTAQKIMYDAEKEGLNDEQRKLAAQYAAKIEAGEKAKKNARTKTKKYDAEDKNLALNVQYLRLTGQEVKANLTDIEGRYNKLLAEFTKHSNVDGINLIKKILPLEQAKAQVDGVQAEINRLYQNQSTQEQRIQAQVQVGLISHLEGQQQLKALYTETVAELEKQIPVLEKLAKMPGAQGEAAKSSLEGMKIKIAELKNAGNDLEKTFKEGLTEGLQTSIVGLAKGTMTLRDAVLNLANTIINAMINIAAQQLAMQAASATSGWWGAIAGAFSSGTVAAATGGYIRGPGTSTSDSIPARLSNGEFVVKADSVAHYGVGFMHAINRRQLRSFSQGGPVSVPPVPSYSEPGLSDSLRDGRTGTQVVASPVNIQQTLAVDSAELFTAGLKTTAGVKAVITMLRANKQTVKDILN